MRIYSMFLFLLISRNSKSNNAEKKVLGHGIAVFEIKNERIQGLWQVFDMLSFNKQVGLN